MATKTLKCCGCKNRFNAETMIRLPAGNFHSISCATEYANEKSKKSREMARNKDTKIRKEAIKKRTGNNGWYSDLQKVVNFYVKHILYKGQPCYTCGKEQKPGDAGGAFHAGHFIPRKQVDPRRFMVENIRIQCYSCNAMNSGMRAEYRERLINEVGLERVEWLECESNHKTLNEQYPEIGDIKKEIARYRRLIKDSSKN